ncbi:MAG: hypothetical protein ACYSWU_27645, partial [Planctomycetota bacterium]
SGEPLEVPFPLYQTLPADFNGDGRHELMCSDEQRRGQILDAKGNLLYQLAGVPAYAAKLLTAPGEQIVTFDSDGTIRIYACPDAEDTPEAIARYENPYYAASMHLWAVGYNKANLGGI